MPRLSAIIPVRNRSGIRLRNCLASLRWQRLPAAELEVVLSDYGSDRAHAASIDALAEEFSATVVRTGEFGEWNRSRALNLGIQGARAPYVFCTDADMIFAADFVPTILQVHDAHPGARDAQPRAGALVVCHCTNLPKDVPEQEWGRDDFEALRARGKVRTSPGTGACQSASRAFFFHARGYDEQFVFWGSEDTDMRDRARAYGLEMVWISDRTAMLHQWHPTSRYSKLLQTRKNALRYWMTRKQIVKNPERWGRLS